MSEIYIILFTLIITLFLNYILNKNEFLVDKKFSSHKSFATNEIIPISGGLIFLICSLYFLSFDNLILKCFIFFIFLVGFLSDTNYLFSPTKRFFLQILIVLLFVYLSETFINSLRIPFLDKFLENIFFKYTFTIFCYLVLINGANFVDGLNTLFLGYSLGVAITCLFVAKHVGISSDINNFLIIVILLSVLYAFNFFGKLLSGDSGAYLISFLLGYYLIYISNFTEIVSPYFVACLLWYPAYECLFSIIRKKIIKTKITEPDNKHLHHYVFIFFKKKLKLKGVILNTFSGTSINFFNFFIFYNAYQNLSQTKNLLLILLVSFIFYNSIYFYLKKISNS